MRCTPGVAGLLIACTPLAAGGDGPALAEAGRAALPHVDGRIDHMAWDAKRERLFVAALGNGSVEVVEWRAGDLPAGRVSGRIEKLSEPQGIAYLPATDELAFTTGGDGKLHVHDATTLKETQCFEVGGDADNVRFDADAGLLWIGCEEGLAVVDVKTWTKVGAVALAGHAESFQLEPGGAQLYANVPGARHVAVVDRAQRKVVATWPLNGVGGDAAGNFPLALDAAAKRLYVGCREPACLLVLDAETGARKAKLPIGGDTDDLFVDVAKKRLYVSCGAGEVSVFSLPPDDAPPSPLAAVSTAAGARTAFFAADARKLFVAVPHRGAQGAEIRVLESR